MPRSGRESGRGSELSLVECLACSRYDIFYALHILSHLSHRRIFRRKRKRIEDCTWEAWRVRLQNSDVRRSRKGPGVARKVMSQF